MKRRPKDRRRLRARASLRRAQRDFLYRAAFANGYRTEVSASWRELILPDEMKP